MKEGSGSRPDSGQPGFGEPKQSSGTEFQSPTQGPRGPDPIRAQVFTELLERAALFKTQEQTKVLAIQLRPEALGKVQMELTSKDGMVSARVIAENPVVRQRLEALTPQIREHLAQQGVNLTHISVDISSGQPDERNNPTRFGTGRRSARITGTGGADDVAEAVRGANVLPELRRMALNIKAIDLTI
jgi:flagellar hook-length control protein FliK